MVISRVVAAQRLMPPFESMLIRYRTTELRRVLNELHGYSLNQIPDIGPQMVRESYLPELYRRLYLNIGVKSARMATADAFGSKSDDTNDRWQYLLNIYIEMYAGTKISLVTDTFKEFLRQQLIEALEEAPGRGIEQQTQYIYDRVMGRWDNVKRWQIRRIVQTEAMEAMSVGQHESMNAIGVEYRKVWTATFHNTRPQHEAMDGVEVGRDEFFILPNGDKMLYPHDSTHGASAENLINCACGTFDYAIR